MPVTLNESWRSRSALPWCPRAPDTARSRSPSFIDGPLDPRILRGSFDSGADPSPRHLAFDLALGLDVSVDLLAELVRLGGVEVDLLLEDVRQAPAGHPHVIQVLHQH